VTVPSWHVPGVIWCAVAALVVMFVVVELVLLAKTMATVEQPEVHERYKAMMLHWPYALLAPYTIFKTQVLPRVFLDTDERAAAGASPGAHRVGATARNARRSPAGNEHPPTEPDAVTRDEYRTALGVVIRKIDALTTDRALLDMLLEEYRALGTSPASPSSETYLRGSRRQTVAPPAQGEQGHDSLSAAAGRGQRRSGQSSWPRPANRAWPPEEPG
jgi:hypothetical protein